MKNTFLRILSISIFAVGVLLGMAYFVSATWADVESVFYGFNRYGNELTSSMHCPVWMTRGETATIRASFKNTADQPTSPSVRFQASNTGTFRTETAHLSLEPGQVETLEWTVSEEDMVLDRFIFGKIFTFASYPMKDVEQTCGILVLDLPGLTGRSLTIGIISLSLIGLATGVILWAAAHWPLKYRSLEVIRAMITLFITVVLGMISAFLAWWLVGILLATLALILMGVIIGSFITTEKT